MFRKLLIAASLALVAGTANAQSVKSTVVASNGVEVTVHSDEFANRYEYAAPPITLPEGFALIGRVDRGETKGAVDLVGAFVYNGEWRYYNSALYRGGDPAEFTSTGRNVGRCSAGRSRYSRSSCTLTERFRIDFSDDDIASHTQDGHIAIQVRATQSTDTVIISVPTSYIEAVNEVSSRPRP